MASRTTPFLRDVPVASAQAEWRRSCSAAVCPARLGAVGLPQGHGLRPVDVAAAAAAGATDVRVHRQPVVAILPTGDEMRPIGSSLEPGELLETNSLMLAGQAREVGCQVVVLPIEPDDEAR